MSTIFSKGVTSDGYKSVLRVTRRFGGVEIGLVNTGEANGVTWSIEGAVGPADTVSVPDFSAVATILAATNVAGDALSVRDVTKAAAVASGIHHYRVKVKSQTPGSSSTWIVYAEDEKE